MAASYSLRNILYLIVLPLIYEFSDYLPETLTTFSRGVYNCYSSQGWTNKTLGGKFEAACVPKNVLACCAPETPEQIQTKFFLFRQSSAAIEITPHDQFKGVLTAMRTVIIAHGWINNFRVEPYINRTVDGWIARGADVIFVDWSRGNKFFEASAANARTVGALTGQLIQFFGVASTTICVGFSHGAHVCGFAGQFLQRNGERLSNCHGIDPGGPLFVGTSANLRLDKRDCDVVSVIHSSSVSGGSGPGLDEKSGNCDFSVNGANTQPGCPEIEFQDLLHAVLQANTSRLLTTVERFLYCSHIRGLVYYNRRLWNESFYEGRPCLRNPVTGHDECNDARGGQLMALPPDSDCKGTDDINVYVITDGDDWRLPSLIGASASRRR